MPSKMPELNICPETRPDNTPEQNPCSKAKPDKMPELNLYWNTEGLDKPEFINKIFAAFGDYCKKKNVLPKLTIIHDNSKGRCNPNTLWNLVDSAYNNHITIALEPHFVDHCEILPIAHLISQINIKHKNSRRSFLIPDAFYLYNSSYPSLSIDQSYTFEVMLERMNDLRSANQNLTFVFASEIDDNNCFDRLRFGNSNASNNAFDKWEIYRSTNNTTKLSDFQFYCFIQNNYEEKSFVSKSNIIIKDGEKAFIATDAEHDYKLWSNNRSKISRSLKGISFEEALQDIEFKVSMIDKRNEKNTTKNVVAKMESFFHLK